MPANETFYGYSTVYSEYIPVNASGVISDRGYLDLAGNRQAIVVLRHGSIYVSIGQRHGSISLDPRSCKVTNTETFRYQITGGSQRYRDAQGNGRGSIEVTAVVRRYHGTCAANAADTEHDHHQARSRRLRPVTPGRLVVTR